MLFDPFEKQFNAPALAVKLDDGFGREVEVVRQQHQHHLVGGIEIPDFTQGLRKGFGRPVAFEADGLVAAETSETIHGCLCLDAIMAS